MTTEQGSAEPTAKIRNSGRTSWWRSWVIYSVLGGLYLALAVLFLTHDRLMSGFLWLALSCVFSAYAFALWDFGVDLTPEAMTVRSVRRRRVPWPEVQAVDRHETPRGLSVVRLILEEGKPVKLGLWHKGDAAAERDFHHIKQWWLTHRGDAWRPVTPRGTSSVS